MNKQIQPTLGKYIAMLMVGVGLIAVGVMLMLLMKDRSVRASVSDLSAVPVETAYSAPELNLFALDGSPASLSDYRGNVVLVNLWATWCPPCRAEMPVLNDFYENYKDDGFVLIAIDQEESRETVQLFVDEFGLTFPVWLDENYRAQQEFKTTYLPSSYLIDREGQVRLLWIGAISAEKLNDFVPKIIEE